MIDGLQLNMTEFPYQQTVPKPLNFNSEEELATDQLISELLCKNAITRCEHEPGEFISKIFLRRKANGSFRMILDLSSFNQIISCSHFKMNTLVKTLTLVTPFCHFASLDLTDAYLSLEVHPLFFKFLRFEWKGQLFQFVLMPFGLKESPFRFTKLCKHLLAVIRQSGFTISGYLDDFLNCEKSFIMCQNAITCTYNTLVSLGFIPNDKKSVYTPYQIIEHLGHILNSITMTVYLPVSKTEAILCVIDQTLKQNQVTVHFLCHFIGKLVSCFVAHPLGRLHYRSLE